MIRVENKEIITKHTITSIEILDGEISVKDRYAAFPVKVYDEHNNLLFFNKIEIRDAEYDAWNSDDYIEEIILSKLEMVKYIAPVVEEPVVETPIVEEPVVETTDEKSTDKSIDSLSGTSGTGENL